ncbi:sialin [Nilaparvata lugens]|uniref:sialin n=1 Tax=Nilaparvata lugens TaxID=108931 RepID=UPI00193CF187|nr:sialin [Nilaparvata lugens]
MEQLEWFPRRYLVAILGFLGFANIYALRVNLSVAIVSMTRNRTYQAPNGTIINLGPEFSWDREIQGLILSSFFYGYIATQILGGYLACHYGGKRLFGVGVLATAIFTLLTPLLAKISVYLLTAARVVEGLFEGVTYPAMHGLWSRWAPPAERSRLVTITLSGSYIGTVCALPLSGALAETQRWSAIFYIFGVLALIWSAVWFYVVSETPRTDKKISEAEREYIEESIGITSSSNLSKIEVPWHSILTSVPVWAIVAAHFCENWGFYTLLTELPTFMTDRFGHNMHDAGVLSSFPFLVMGIVVQCSGYLADWLRSTGLLSTMQVRKLFTCSGFMSQAIFLVAAAHLSSPGAVIATLTVAVGFGGLAWSGFSVNQLDIAPQFASVLMGLSNTVATIPGIISPLLTGHLIRHKTIYEWQTVFMISSCVYILGAIIYSLLASGKIQPWAFNTQECNTLLDDQSHTSNEELAPPTITTTTNAAVEEEIEEDDDDD